MCFTGIAAQCRGTQGAQICTGHVEKCWQFFYKAGPEAAALSASRRESAQQAIEHFELRLAKLHCKGFFVSNLHKLHYITIYIIYSDDHR